MYQHWLEVNALLKNYPKHFTLQKGKDYKNNYYWAYQFVMTRIFQWCQPTAVLLPYAEFQNHHHSLSKATDHYCFNRNFEEAPAMTGGKPYILKHQQIDVSLIRAFGKPSPTERKPDTTKPKDQIELINWNKTISDPNVQVFDHDYLSSDDEEDNDSGDEDWYVEDDSLHDQDFSWYSHTDQDVYFLVTTKRSYQAGEPICCTYGNRTSRFLLKWYGFCESESNVDSVQFQLWLHQRKLVDETSIAQALFCDFITTDEEQHGVGKDRIPTKLLSTPFRLKSNCINEELLIYLRNLAVEQLGKTIKVMALPSDLSIEYEAFKTMQTIIKLLTPRLTQEQVEALQTVAKGPNGRASVASIYQLNRWWIIRRQRDMVDRVIQILLRLQSGFTLRDAYIVPFENDTQSTTILIRDYLRQLQVGIFRKA